MDYTLIKGTFHVVGYSPDGDSVMFKANNKAHWRKINTDYRETFEEKLAADNGAVMLRLQGIDALETHYSPTSPPTPPDLKRKKPPNLKKPVPGDHEQPGDLGRQAADVFLKYLGFKEVEWRSWGKRKWISRARLERRRKEIWTAEKQADGVPGYIVTADVEKNGRPIAWVFSGSTRKRDGTRLSREALADRVEQSANYQLLRQGLVYPYFFMTLPGRLREKLAEAAQQAQAEGAQQAQSLRRGGGNPPQKQPNLWIYDRTVEGIKITTVGKITHDYEMFPYLFRKVLKHWHRTNLERYWQALRGDGRGGGRASNSRVSLKGFFEHGNPYVFVVSEQDFVRLDSVVAIKGNTLKMTKYPFDIVFLS